MVETPHRESRSRDDRSALPDRVGVWAGALTAALAGGLLVIGLLTPVRAGPFCTRDCLVYPYSGAGSLFPGDSFWMVPGILLAPAVLVLEARLLAAVPADRRIFGRVSGELASGYVAAILIAYLTQILAVTPMVRSGHADSVAFFTQYNPNGMFLALECTGYLLLNASLLFVGLALPRTTRTEEYLWGLFGVAFLASVATGLAVALTGSALVVLEIGLITITTLTLILAGLGSAREFHRLSRSPGGPELPPGAPSVPRDGL